MRITVIAVGRLKERFYRDAVQEYAKRLGRYCKLRIVEVEDEPAPERAGDAEREQILYREGEKIAKKLQADAYTVTLEIEGGRMDSPAFAERIRRLGVEGRSHIQFVIGGSLGLHASIRRRADLALSFSDMTFPHQLMRVILLEQLYRAFRIMTGEPYHK